MNRVHVHSLAKAILTHGRLSQLAQMPWVGILASSSKIFAAFIRASLSSNLESFPTFSHLVSSAAEVSPWNHLLMTDSNILLFFRIEMDWSRISVFLDSIMAAVALLAD
jgi:hypothetical protein